MDIKKVRGCFRNEFLFIHSHANLLSATGRHVRRSQYQNRLLDLIKRLFKDASLDEFVGRWYGRCPYKLAILVDRLLAFGENDILIRVLKDYMMKISNQTSERSCCII